MATKIYPNWDFCYETKPSGNPGAVERNFSPFSELEKQNGCDFQSIINVVDHAMYVQQKRSA
jgi:hypothetical protein